MIPVIIETFRWLVLAAVALSAGVLLVAWAAHERWAKVAVTICAILALVFALLALLNLHP